MTESHSTEPHEHAGRETSRRRDMPDAHGDAEEFVEQVDEPVPDEHLQQRVEEHFENRAEQSGS